jgi:hypothetical protein
MRCSPAVLPPLAAVLAFAAATAAQEPASALALAGQPVLALGRHAAVAGVLRQASGGRQRIVAERLRLPGPPMGVAVDRFVYGWGCDPRGCREEGLFLGFDTMRERMYLLVVEDGAPSLFVPPRTAPWPETLAEPLRAFHPTLAAALRPGGALKRIQRLAERD